MGSLLEPALDRFVDSVVEGSWAVDLLDRIAVLVSSARHNILLHLELQATVIPNQSFVFAISILGHHKGRIALFHLVALSVFYEFFEELVFGKKLMI